MKQPGEKQSEPVMAMNTQLNPIRTLVVDDSQDECMLLNAELRSIYSIQLIGFVHDGVEAISYLRGIEQFKNREMHPYPDLMLLDFSMPRCGGMGVLEFLHKQFHRPRVILWSNTLECVSVAQAMRLGADLVCHKPATQQELKEVIRRVEARVFKNIVPTPSSEQEQQPEAFCLRA